MELFSSKNHHWSLRRRKTLILIGVGKVLGVVVDMIILNQLVQMLVLQLLLLQLLRAAYLLMVLVFALRVFAYQAFLLLWHLVRMSLRLYLILRETCNEVNVVLV